MSVVLVLAIVLAAVVAVVVTGTAAFFLCYGGLRGPVDWMSSTVHRGRSDDPRVALTFDDGPHPAHTPALLDALAQLDVKATFFLVGAAVDAHPALARRIADEGHEIGNHTYRHRYLPLMSSRAVDRELVETDRAIAAATGRAPTLARPPYGGRSPWNVRAYARRAKRVVLWDLNSFDWRGAPSSEVAARVMERVGPGSIVLLHEARDGGDVTVETVRRLVPALRARGLAPATVGALVGAA